jgi:molybdopterin-dependent oxidoreductase alpha subunit
MCHEASGRALQASLGTGKGTADLKDWECTDALFIMGVNAASNAPRMLTALADAYRRGAAIVHVNPLVEAAATRTIVPHEFVDMALFKSTRTSTLNLQVRIGGDMALVRGMAKAILEQAAADPKAVDREFVERYTHGFEEYEEACRSTSWDEIERQCGLGRADILRAAKVYRDADRSIFSWCLGLTQHEHGVDAVREIVNLLLLRGNLGREGAGPSPVRGHSNVQGNRTCGIDHRPTAEFLDRLAQVCGIDPPRAHGMDTVRTIAAMHRGDVRVFVGMGGNFALAAARALITYEGLRQLDLTVQVSTKLNRSHLVHGRQALILPCLGRTEIDVQDAGPQSITVEDSMSMVHASAGRNKPASEHLMSEVAIVAGVAKATLAGRTVVDWDSFVANYDRIRDAIEDVFPIFQGYNARIRVPGGFHLTSTARERVWATPSGKANFLVFDGCGEDPPECAPDFLWLSTIRSHDQYNTTLYSMSDRYRGVFGQRDVVFLNEAEMKKRGFADGDRVDLITESTDGAERIVRNFRVVGYSFPDGCCAAYYPETNPLVPLYARDPQSFTPSYKGIPIRLVRSAASDPGGAQ